jgi:hypothetical protein
MEKWGMECKGGKNTDYEEEMENGNRTREPQTYIPSMYNGYPARENTAVSGS